MRDEKGFSLLEVVVSVGLTAVVVLAVLTVWEAAVRLETRTRTAVDAGVDPGLVRLWVALGTCRPYAWGRRAEGLWMYAPACTAPRVAAWEPAGPGRWQPRWGDPAEESAVRLLFPLAGEGGELRVVPPGGCTCRSRPSTWPTVECPPGCVPGPGRTETRAYRDAASGVAVYVWVGRRPADLPPAWRPWVAARGLTVLPVQCQGDCPPAPPGETPWVPAEPLPMPVWATGVSDPGDLTLVVAGGRRYMQASAPWAAASGVLDVDLDGNGDGRLDRDDRPAFRPAPASAAIGWVLHLPVQPDPQARLPAGGVPCGREKTRPGVVCYEVSWLFR